MRLHDKVMKQSITTVPWYQKEIAGGRASRRGGTKHRCTNEESES